MKTLVLNGPNLNRLGKREPAIYGSQTLADLQALCAKTGEELGLEVSFRQTNAEYEMLEWLHEAADNGYPVVLNAAAWTHYSVAVGDACAQLTAPLIEVHLSNVFAREEFRHRSFVSAHAKGVIAGLGFDGYTAALRRIAALTA